MNYNKIDYFLLPFTFLCFLVSLYFLVADQLITNFSKENSIAEITFKSNTVRTKGGDSLFWSNASSGEKLEQNDKIYTHVNSEAEVSIQDGPKISISQNTLLSLSQFSRNKEVIVTKGHIVAELSDGDKDFKVRIGNKTMVLKGTNARVRVAASKEDSSVSVLSGEVSFQDNSKIIKVKKGQVITKGDTNGVHVSSSLVELIAPLDGAKVFLNSHNSNVSFKWKGKTSGKIQISKNYSFKNVLVTKDIKSFKTTLSVRPGKYYWRIKDGAKESIRQSFTAIPEQSTKLNSPRDNSDILYISKKPQVFFDWDDPYFTNFEISINGRILRVLSKSSLQTSTLGEGRYEWKVRPLNSKDSKWSKLKRFSINRPPLPNAPDLLSPSNNHEVIVFPKSNASFRWTASDTRAKFMFELALDPKFKNILTKEETDRNNVNIQVQKSGTYYWRVKEIDELKRESKYSLPSTVVINLYESDMIPSTGAKLTINKPSKKVEFKWKDLRTKSKRKVSYTFELSKSKSFSKLEKAASVNTNYIETEIPQTGLYYWRTKIDIPGEPPYYGEPQRVTVSPTPPPSKPKIQEKLEIELKINSFFNNLKRIFTSIMNFLIPSASASELKTSAIISWDKIEDTKLYFLEIFSDKNLEKKIIDVQLKENSYALENFDEGTYYWRISTLDFWNRKSEFSNISQLSLSLPKSFHLISKAKLLSPSKKSKYTGDRKYIKFRWKKSPEAKEYKIYLSKQKSFKKTYLMRTIKKNNYSVSLSKGKYFWKVVSFNKYGKSRESSVSTFNIEPKKLKREIKKTIVKSVNKELKSYFYFQYDLSLSSMTQTYPNYSINAKDPIFTSFELGNHLQLKTGSINTMVRRFSGKVFESESYGILDLQSSFSYNLIGNFNILAGLSLSNYKTYQREGGTISSKSNTSLSFPIGISYFTSFNENRNILSLSYSIGSLSRILIRNTFDFNFDEKTYFSMGAGYERYSATIEESDFIISNIMGFFRYNISY